MCLHWASSAAPAGILLLCSLAACTGNDSHSQPESALRQQTIVDDLFDRCDDGDPDEVRKLLSRSTLQQLGEVDRRLGEAGKDEALLALIAVLRRLHRPACLPIPDETGGEVLRCRNLGGEFELEVVDEDGTRRVALPALDAYLDASAAFAHL